jgi:hypothetical protein
VTDDDDTTQLVRGRIEDLEAAIAACTKLPGEWPTHGCSR